MRILFVLMFLVSSFSVSEKHLWGMDILFIPEMLERSKPWLVMRDPSLQADFTQQSEKKYFFFDALHPEYAKKIDQLGLPWDGKANAGHHKLMRDAADVTATELGLKGDAHALLRRFVERYPLYAKEIPYFYYQIGIMDDIIAAWHLAAKMFFKMVF